MDFKEFVNKLEQDLKDAMADISPGASVSINSVEKLQEGSYTGITISPSGGNIGVNLNVDQLYEQLQEGNSYEGVLAVAVSTAERGIHDMPAVDVSELTNYEAAKKYLCVDVVGSDRNADMLEKVPHTDMENISMVYRLQLDSNENGAVWCNQGTASYRCVGKCTGNPPG